MAFSCFSLVCFRFFRPKHKNFKPIKSPMDPLPVNSMLDLFKVQSEITALNLGWYHARPLFIALRIDDQSDFNIFPREVFLQIVSFVHSLTRLVSLIPEFPSKISFFKTYVPLTKDNLKEIIFFLKNFGEDPVIFDTVTNKLRTLIDVYKWSRQLQKGTNNLFSLLNNFNENNIFDFFNLFFPSILEIVLFAYELEMEWKQGVIKTDLGIVKKMFLVRQKSAEENENKNENEENNTKEDEKKIDEISEVQDFYSKPTPFLKLISSSLHLNEQRSKLFYLGIKKFLEKMGNEENFVPTKRQFFFLCSLFTIFDFQSHSRYITEIFVILNLIQRFPHKRFDSFTLREIYKFGTQTLLNLPYFSIDNRDYIKLLA